MAVIHAVIGDCPAHAGAVESEGAEEGLITGERHARLRVVAGLDLIGHLIVEHRFGIGISHPHHRAEFGGGGQRPCAHLDHGDEEGPVSLRGISLDHRAAEGRKGIECLLQMAIVVDEDIHVADAARACSQGRADLVGRMEIAAPAHMTARLGGGQRVAVAPHQVRIVRVVLQDLEPRQLQPLQPGIIDGAVELDQTQASFMAIEALIQAQCRFAFKQRIKCMVGYAHLHRAGRIDRVSRQGQGCEYGKKKGRSLEILRTTRVATRHGVSSGC